MSYSRRVIPIAFFFGALFLFSSNRSIKHELDSNELVLQNYRDTDSLVDWINHQKSFYNDSIRNRSYYEAIDFIDQVEDEVQLWREPSRDDELKAWGSILLYRAYAKDRLGDFMSAKKDYLRVLGIYKEINEVNYKVIRYVYHPLANIYTRQGDNERAILLLKVYVDSAIVNNDPLRIGRGYSDLGTAVRNQGDFVRALNIYEEGIELAKGSDEALGLLTSNAAVACLYSGKYEEGIEFGLLSLDHLNRIENPNNPEYIPGVYQTLLELTNASGNYSKAESYMERAMESLGEVYPLKNHRKWGKLYLAIGDLRFNQKQYGQSLKNYQNALSSVISEIGAATLHSLPDRNQLYSEVVISDAIIKKAKVYLKLAELNQVHRKEYLKHAFLHYECYFEMEGVHRRELIDESSKLMFVQEVHKYGEEAIETALKLYNETNDKVWLDQCVLFTERTKGIILSESVDARVLNEQGDFPDLVSRFIELKSQFRQITIRLRIAQNEKDTINLESLKKREIEMGNEIGIFNEKIKQQFPSLYRELFESNRLSIKDIQHFRKSESANILTYYFGQRNVYCFSLNKETAQFKKIKITEELMQSFDELLTELYNPLTSTSKKYSELASRFCQKLFEPFKKSFTGKNVIVIPDGVLAKLPFEALCNNKSNDFEDLNYLVNDYSIRYAYSVKWLNRKFSPTKFSKNFLGIAPLFENQNKHAPLPFSRKEIKYGEELGGDSLIGEQATKNNFLKKAKEKDYRILHLSTHAEMWNPDFEQASIAFFGEKDTEDAYLLASELSTLQIAPELIVLSACETGKGNFIRGEGMLSLSRTFAQSGTKNVVASLWKVNHESTSEVMLGFYDALGSEGNMSISNSLTSSKRKYLKKNKRKGSLSHPYYWSGMIQMGNDDLNLELDENKGFNWWLLLTIPAIGLIIYRIKLHLKRRSLAQLNN